MPPDKPPPYRIEWRLNLVTQWQLMGNSDKHDAARTLAKEVRGRHGGQTRVIVQHVIELAGVGTGAP